MKIAEDICFKLARKRVLARKTGDAGENRHTFDETAYRAWRSEELRGQFRDHFGAESVAGLDILDLGCGEGELSFLMAKMGAKSVTGIDAIGDRVRSAQRRAATETGPVVPKFSVAADLEKIALPDASVDLILCFDVLEHILSFESIIPEWKRVLRPGGRVFIWWVPWFHPYGHHIESLVPLPWCHAVFSEKTLVKTCARIYDMPEFKPRLWDLDAAGLKKPNKWQAMTELPDVNRLTIGRFERILKRTGLAIVERRARGFSGGLAAKIAGIFTRLPILREFFTAYLTYKLERR